MNKLMDEAEELSKRFDEIGVPHWFAISTGKTHGDDGENIVNSYHNLEHPEQFKHLIDMIEKTRDM